MNRSLLHLLVSALALLAGSAAAQTYQLRQAGQTIGTFRLELSQAASGTVSDSTLTISGVADLTDHLAVDAAGHALGYRLQGTARGRPITLDVAFQDHQAAFTIDQGGTRQTLEVALPGPVYILDNSMLDGWQILASRLEPGSSAPQRFDVLVPQAARTGTVTFTAAGPASVDVGGSSVSAQRFDASLDVAGQKVGLTLWRASDGRLLAFEQASASLRYELETPASRASAAASAAKARTERAALDRRLAEQRRCLTEKDVHVASTGQTLAGTLTIPVDAPAAGAPALLLLPGSGAVDRNGNAPPVITNDMYEQVAYALACDGFAVLRIDKLGIGKSTGDGNAVTLQTYARNTADWVALLRAMPGIDPRRIGLMGHSEGGLVALYAAGEGIVDPTAVVLLESPGLPFDQVILDQLVGQARLRGATPAELAATEAQVRQAVQAIRASSGTRLTLSGPLASNPLAVAFAHAAGLLRSEFAADPTALAARITVPVLVVQGRKDVQVLPQNGEALARSAPHATYLLFPDLEHDLYTTAGSAIENALPGPGTVLSETLLHALAIWLTGALLPAP